MQPKVCLKKTNTGTQLQISGVNITSAMSAKSKKFDHEGSPLSDYFNYSGGDISPDGSTLALTNKEEAYAWSLPEGSTWFQYLSQAPDPCILSFQVLLIVTHCFLLISI